MSVFPSPQRQLNRGYSDGAGALPIGVKKVKISAPREQAQVPARTICASASEAETRKNRQKGGGRRVLGMILLFLFSCKKKLKVQMLHVNYTMA